ncbi:hypothetical protein H9X86_04785 [Pseudoflavonifractor capillosus]|uniref:hypothetical protein n=1 Tax=Pseudoflavonifractor capillosus TaxID=106588 RepID=UPI001955F59B|nr:hypothetical protein [Pseudoflavonifractor capillosus]MBM6896688.1 hypothetical protein [Pseudoflavonifractor capillosus]
MTRPKTLHRWLAILLSLVLVMGMMPATVFAADDRAAHTGTDGHTTTLQDGTSAAIPGEGTQESPYQIGTAQQLMDFAALVNAGNNGAYAVLTADIHMSSQSWAGISGNGSYTGVFDGKGYTISNLTGTEGLFVNNAGTVKNVWLKNVSLTKNGGNLGAVVGMNTGTVFNCVSSGSITGTGSEAYSIGGLVGHNNGGTLSGSASSCTVRGSTAGGLTGSNWNKSSSNYGKIIACIYTGTASKPVEGDRRYGQDTNVYYREQAGTWKSYPDNGTADEGTLLDIVNSYISNNGGAFFLKGDGTAYPSGVVSYLDYTQDGFVTRYIDTYTVINSEIPQTAWTDGWYVVDGEVTIDSRVTITGDVKLILKNGADLTANDGIHVSSEDSFTLYAQSAGVGMGTLVATGPSNQAGIGGGKEESCGEIIINGGTITANGGRYAMGLGGNPNGTGGNITVNGGTVMAQGGDGYSSGWSTTPGGPGLAVGQSGIVTIHGGNVIATGGNGSKDIFAAPGGVGIKTGTNGETHITAGFVNAQPGAWESIGIAGNFSTGPNGNAVIVTQNIENNSNSQDWNGLFFIENAVGALDKGVIYGQTVTPTCDFTVPSGVTVTIEKTQSLVISQGITMTNDGTIINSGTINNQGTISNSGSLQVESGGIYDGNQPSGNAVTYQIDWDTNGDGTVDDTTYVAYGETPSHTDGSKEGNAQYSYQFAGWTPTLAQVIGTATYTAQFTQNVNSYQVTVPSDPGYSVAYTGNTTLEYGRTFTFSLDIAQGYYKAPDFAVKANGTALTPDTEGNYTVQVLNDTQITIEGVAQEAALAAPAVDTHGYNSEWTANDVTLTPSATADSGIAYYEYSKDNGQSWTQLSGSSLTISESFFATDYIFRAVSHAGNISAASEPVTVKLDKDPVSITLTGNTQDYLQTDTLEILVNIGLSGCSRLEIKNEDGTWTAIEPSGGFVTPVEYPITENGTYTFRAISGAGVVGAEQSITYTNIDSVKPVVAIDSGSYVSDTWSKDHVTLSVSNTAANSGTTTFQYKVGDGNWQTCNGAITVSEETDGTVYTFKAISASGVESDQASITVKLDQTAPDGDIKIQENSVKQLLNQITFGLFFNKNVDVTISGTDALSGVASIQFYRSQDILTQEEAEDISDWQDYTSITETAVDAEKFVYYARITDQAGNFTVIGSNGVTFDLTAPTISGITNGSTYYTTQNVTVADANLATVTVNGVPEDEALTLAGNVAQTYTIVATDKAGNSTTVTVTMKPIASLADPIKGITADTVTSKDQAAIESVKADTEAVNTEYATDEEQAELKEILDTCNALLAKIEESAQAGNTENTDKVEDITADNVKPEDKDDLISAKEDLEDALDNFGDNYTQEEKQALEDKLDQINQALESIEKVESVQDAISALPDTVEPDDTDVEAIIDAVKEQYEALTDHEKSLVGEALKEKLEHLLAALGDYRMTQGQNAQWTQGTQTGLTFTVNGAFSKFTGIEVDGKAVDQAHYTAVSGSTIVTLKPKYLDTLSVGQHTLTVLFTDAKVDGQFEILAKPQPGTPDTGDNSQVTIWIGLLFAAVCGLAGTMVYTRKKKHSK